MFRSFQVHPLHGCMEQFIESDFRRKGILQNNLKWGDFREHFGEVSIGWEFSVLSCWCWVWLFRKKWGGTNKRIYWESNRIFGGVTWFSSTSETSEYGFIRKLWSQEERATTRKKTQELQHQHHQTTTKKHQPNNNYTTWTGHNWTWPNTQETVIATLTKSDLLPSNSSSRKAGDEGCCIFSSAWFGGRNEPSLVVWSPADGPHRHDVSHVPCRYVHCFMNLCMNHVHVRHHQLEAGQSTGPPRAVRKQIIKHWDFWVTFLRIYFGYEY